MAKFEEYSQTLKNYLIKHYRKEGDIENVLISLEREARDIITALNISPSVIPKDSYEVLVERYCFFRAFELIGNFDLSQQAKQIFDDLVDAVKISLEEKKNNEASDGFITNGIMVFR